MDFLLFAVEHGRPAAIVFAALFSVSATFFTAIGGYDLMRSSANITGANLVQANFDLENLQETEGSRHIAFLCSFIASSLVFVVSLFISYAVAFETFKIIYEKL